MSFIIEDQESFSIITALERVNYLEIFQSHVLG